MNIGLKWLGALALGSALSACYVVPVSSNMRVVGTSTSAAPVAINNTLQARLYPFWLRIILNGYTCSRCRLHNITAA